MEATEACHQQWQARWMTLCGYGWLAKSRTERPAVMATATYGTLGALTYLGKHLDL